MWTLSYSLCEGSETTCIWALISFTALKGFGSALSSRPFSLSSLGYLLIFYVLDIQNVVHGLTVSPGSMLEMQNLRLHHRPLSQNLGTMIPQVICMHSKGWKSLLLCLFALFAPFIVFC